MTLLCWIGAALLPLATARSIIPRQDTTTITNFGIIALHSASPIHLSSVNAADNKFWIGRDTETYCPAIEGLVCPTNVYTQFSVSSSSESLALDTIVPGGQSVYVTPSGALGFTTAHSAASPDGSSFVSFHAEVPETSSTPGSLSYNGTENFLACPTKRGKGPYQVFVDIPGISDKDVPGRLSKCIGFAAAAFRSPENASTAWQYD